ncbi:unnamed protein product [Adineta ricciae]|uniref:Uncharacterized protein n=1 Tax=Adineta ricciae TaxID=249248 RepID=A0A816DXN1_ADIRI|nr:unnamed protein product [Adineta ricciae]
MSGIRKQTENISHIQQRLNCEPEIMLRMLHTTSGRKNFDKVSVDPSKDKQDKSPSSTKAAKVEAETKDAINSAVQTQPPIDSADTKKT